MSAFVTLNFFITKISTISMRFNITVFLSLTFLSVTLVSGFVLRFPAGALEALDGVAPKQMPNLPNVEGAAGNRANIPGLSETMSQTNNPKLASKNLMVGSQTDLQVTLK